MNLKKVKRRVIIVVSSLLVVLVALLLMGLLYLKLFGLQDALKNLVSLETENRYSLTIAKSSVSLSTLSFAFDSLTITRNPDLPETGIRQVTITSLKLQVANIGSMFRSKKYDIKTLIVDEPQIQIDNNRSQDSLREKFHLGQQVVKLYPAIESVLKRFNIEHLKINRGSLGVNNDPNPPLTLGLVDFLIEAWDENRLTEKSQLQLKIGEQALKLEKAAFGFSAIEYNLQNHQLSLENVQFATADSVSNSHVEVFAEKLVLNKLGFIDLFEHQRLTYEKVTVSNPVVDLHLVLKKKSNEVAVKTNEKEVLTRIIKQSVGECIVDTVVIQNASVKTVLEKEGDSTVIALPKVNFTLYTFEITNESEVFRTGTADIEFDRTTIALTDGISITCQKLQFDQESNLIFEDVEVYDAENELVVLDCHSLRLTQFHLLPLLFDRELLIGSLTIEKAVVNVPSENLFGGSGKGKKKGLKLIDVKEIVLKDVALNHHSENLNLVTKGLSLSLSRVQKKGAAAITYAFRDLLVADALVELREHRLTAHVYDIDFNSDFVRAKAIQLNQEELAISLKHVMASHSERIEEFQDIDYTRWESLTAEELTLSGKLPEKKAKVQSDSTKPAKAFYLGRLDIAHVTANLTGQDFKVSTVGADLSIDEVEVFNGDVLYAAIHGVFKGVKLQMPKMEAAIGVVQVALPNQVSLSNTAISKNDMHFTFPKATIYGLSKKESVWTLKKASVSHFVAKKGTHDLIVTDSLLAEELTFGGGTKASLARLEVFKPAIKLQKKDEGKKTSVAKINWEEMELLQNLIVHPGTIELPSKSFLAFGEVKINPSAKSLTSSYLRSESKKQVFDFTGLTINDQKIKVDTLHISPNPSWQEYKTIEQSIASAKMYGTTITGYSLDSLLLKGILHNIHILIPRFHISVTRDLRLDDGPFVEKPATLGGMINLPKAITMNSAKLANGVIEVSQISDKTGQEGSISITGVWADVNFNHANPRYDKVTMIGGGKLCDQGIINVTYKTLDADLFSLKASLTDFDLVKLNQIVLPLQAVEIKSGYLKRFDMDITANNNLAIGDATITYNDLHLIIYKSESPEEKNIGSELLTFLADGLVLKNSKKNASFSISKSRVKNKGTFHYWIAAAIQGSLGAVKSGKSQK